MTARENLVFAHISSAMNSYLKARAGGYNLVVKATNEVATSLAERTALSSTKQ